MIADARLDAFDDYIAAVSSGEQAVCRNVAAAVSRHDADLQRSETADFPYYFDRDAAGRAVDWFHETLRHTIGRFATLPFKLEPWQAFGVGSIFGWKRQDDGTRRFRKVFWTMGRKNGKSCLAAGIGIHGAGYDVDPTTGCAESVGQIILAAAKREQADLVTFAEVERMCQASGKLQSRTQKKRYQIHFPDNGSQILTVGSNKAYDGLNPSMVLLDELHAWRETHRAFYDTMLTGSGSRSQPLTVITTTAGDTQSFIWLSEYKYAVRVAHQEIEDEKLFSFIFELDPDDDPLDESTWIKANPNLGVSLKADYLRDQAKRAKESILDLNRFKRYHCNILVDANESVFTKAEWDACEGELSDWSEADAIGTGIDLGSRDDFASFAMVARFQVNDDEDSPIYRFEGKQWSFISRECDRDLTKAPFADWIHDGKLHVSPSPLLDLKDTIVEECTKYPPEALAYDPAGGQFLAESIEREGYEIASMGQTYAMFNEPITELLRIVRDEEFRHNGDPVLAWAMGNAIVVRDRQDRWMFDKKNAREKIDPAVSLVMAFRVAQTAIGRGTGPLYVV